MSTNHDHTPGPTDTHGPTGTGEISDGLRQWDESCPCCISQALPEVKQALDEERATRPAPAPPAESQVVSGLAVDTLSRPSMSTFSLQPTAPFRLDLTVWALRRRPHNSVDRWDDDSYRRVMAGAHGPIDVEVRQSGPAHRPELRVSVAGPGARLSATRTQVASTLQRCLGLALDLSPFYRLAAADSLLGPLVERFRGLRPPRFPSPIEALANAVSCQQLSLDVGIHLLNRLSDTYGRSAQSGAHAFPDEHQLGVVPPEGLRELGYSTRKGRVLVALARQVADGVLSFGDLAGQDNAATLGRLCQLDGIGRWSAEYVMLRGLGRTDVFPGDDVGAQNKLRRWLSIEVPMDYPAVSGIVARWQPYGGLVYFHLLLDSLATSGLLPA